jgi:dienelactone hydrolase
VPDWAPVLDAATSWLTTRPEVDSDRLVLMGVNHGSYFAASALTAGRTLPSAMVVDPGVVDLGAEARKAVEQADGDPTQLAQLRGTTTAPTGTDTLDAALEVLDRCTLDLAQLGRRRCPTLVVDAEDATSFAGQGATLLAALQDAHVLRLTHAEGAGADCGLDASQIHDAQVFDWLDDRSTGRTP